jgi:hypothetical protein
MRVCIGLVHNNGSHVPGLIAELNKLQRLLECEGMCVNFIKAGFQPKVTSHGFMRFISRRMTYVSLGFKWLGYRNKKNYLGFIFCEVINFLRIFNDVKNLRRNSQIETYVTDKHLRIWSSAVDVSDYVIIFEDDVIIKEDSFDRLVKLLLFLGNQSGDFYVDLAGGLKISDLGIEKLVKHGGMCCSDSAFLSGFVEYERLVTNTACGYLLSKGVLSIFLSHLVANPGLRHVGIDWLINGLSMVEDLNVSCLHSRPEIFKHGSFTGEHISWQIKSSD